MPLEHTVIDRRGNPSGRNLPNRAKFLRRARKDIQGAIQKALAKRKVDATGGEEVSIPVDGVEEPTFHHSRNTGSSDTVVPGNKNYREGDRIPKPQGGEGGRDREGSPDGSGEDAFEFVLTEEELLNMAFEGLELPNMQKRGAEDVEHFKRHRAGYSVSGTTANIALLRTMRQSIGRRIALRRPSQAEIDELKKTLTNAQGRDDQDEVNRLVLEIEEKERRFNRIGFLDPIDVRYRRYERVPDPITQAVMFCLMDVSGSMTEDMKDLAKRLFMLLNILLKRRYQRVAVVFIRHTSTAQVVDHDEFFYSRETGGTVVSTVLVEMVDEIRRHFPPSEWNIYGAQVSDGDNYGSDNDRCIAVLENELLALCQDFIYVEIGEGNPSGHETTLWRAYTGVAERQENFAMRHLDGVEELVALFHELYPNGGVRAKRVA